MASDGGVAVDDLVVGEAGQRAADDIAGDVTAGAARGHPDALEAVEDLDDVLEPESSGSGSTGAWCHR